LEKIPLKEVSLALIDIDLALLLDFSRPPEDVISA
jgi:hypothetical protein